MVISLITFLVFLFTFYVLAKDDFVYLRKNITLEQLFDTVFLGLPIVLLLARILYVAFHPSWAYLNPFVFFIVPYFPGLFVGGGILGAVIFLFTFTKNKKIPSMRLADELSLAFLASSSAYFFMTGLQEGLHRHVVGVALGALCVLYLVGYFLVRSLFSKEKWLDGAVAAFVLVMHSLFSLLYVTMLVVQTRKFTITPDIFFYVILLLVSIGFFIERRGILRRSK